jgi:hypothetical protein
VPAPRIKDKFIKLPMPQKIIGIGAFITFISTFFPWYKDIDVYNTGDQYLGITGPLYLIGYIIIALSLFSLILTGFHFLEKKLPNLPLKESLIYLLSGAICLFLLIITNSIYFHEKFGTNILSKEYQIGMILAFIGSIAITVGGFLTYQERGTSRLLKEFQEETRAENIDPVLELNNSKSENYEKNETITREHNNLNQISQKPSINTNKGREYKVKPENETKVRIEPYPDPEKIKRERQSLNQQNNRIQNALYASEEKEKAVQTSTDEKEVNPNSIIRMDL